MARPASETRIVAATTSADAWLPAEEKAARGVVAQHRARLDWALRVPEWESLLETGADELGLPGRRQGIPFVAAMAALPLESKYHLVRWVLSHFRNHISIGVARGLCRLNGVEVMRAQDVEDNLSVRQWSELRREILFRLAHEHRRYKHAQQLLFINYRHLVDRVVSREVFSETHRADCAQEGAMGLLQAIDHVDDSTRQLAAYALSWIRRHVRNYLMRQRLPVHAPVNLVSEALAAAGRTRDEVEENENEKPSYTGGEPESRAVALVLECLRQPAVSLDASAECDGHPSTRETLVDDAGSPVEEAVYDDMRTLVARMLGALTEKQRDVIVERYGLDGGTARSLAEIARDQGISHQQVSMREQRALHRLEQLFAPHAAELYGPG